MKSAIKMFLLGLCVIQINGKDQAASCENPCYSASCPNPTAVCVPDTDQSSPCEFKGTYKCVSSPRRLRRLQTDGSDTRVAPCICTKEYQPLCCDGENYDNPCIAECITGIDRQVIATDCIPGQCIIPKRRLKKNEAIEDDKKLTPSLPDNVVVTPSVPLNIDNGPFDIDNGATGLF
mmetsp:Transcript_43255/g.38487  ORF Transcript_43255/g.38487 Transcript_43255/m.38487 type:complete len:177 (-) Transcript_43255:143-673(-)